MYVGACKLFAKQSDSFKVNISVHGKSIKEILDELCVLVSREFNLRDGVPAGGIQVAPELSNVFSVFRSICKTCFFLINHTDHLQLSLKFNFCLFPI